MIAFVLSLNCWVAEANVLYLRSSLTEEVLSESVPTAFSPGSVDIQDYALEWAGPSIPGIRSNLVKGSLQWVRVQDVLVIPRARLALDLEDIDSGQISNSGFTEMIEVRSRQGHVEIPVALISGSKNSIWVKVKKNGTLFEGELRLRFRAKQPRSLSDSQIYVDPSCSAFAVEPESIGRSGEDWAYVGCRLVRVNDQEGQTSSLEVFVFWDHVGQVIRIGGIDAPAPTTSVWPFRLTSSSDPVLLEGKYRQILLHFNVAKRLYNTQLNWGFGPYSYSFRGNGENLTSILPLIALDGTYFISEPLQVVAFGSTAGDSHHYTDLGFYFRIQNQRILDNRVGLHLLLGLHAVGFSSQGQFYPVISFPQGVEFLFYDAFTRNQNLGFGAFIYPLIAGNAYYDIWLKWGNRIFLKAHYYLWQAQSESVQFTTTGIGISVGFPLTQF